MVLLEQISDEQMHIFKANIENKGKTMNEVYGNILVIQTTLVKWVFGLDYVVLD